MSASIYGNLAHGSDGLPDINSKVNIIRVEALFEGPNYKTEVWISDAVVKAFGKLDKEIRRRFVGKIREMAAMGFSNFEGGEGHPVKYEGDHVYRVGIKSSLFRLIGFYDEKFGLKRSFIGIEAEVKSGQRRGRSGSESVARVAAIRKGQHWKRHAK